MDKIVPTAGSVLIATMLVFGVLSDLRGPSRSGVPSEPAERPPGDPPGEILIDPPAALESIALPAPPRRDPAPAPAAPEPVRAEPIQTLPPTATALAEPPIEPVEQPQPVAKSPAPPVDPIPPVERRDPEPAPAAAEPPAVQEPPPVQPDDRPIADDDVIDPAWRAGERPAEQSVTDWRANAADVLPAESEGRYVERVPDKATPPAAPAVHAVKEGRILLRVLEQGAGPSVEIAWPDRARERDALFAILHRCLGMRIALLAVNGALYGEDGRPGEPWALNLDRYSGFVREPQGRLTAEERAMADGIRDRHGVRGTPVRVFPRRIDAALLGGLKGLIGTRYGGSSTIRARYRRTAGGVSVESIAVDGSRVEGAVWLAGTCPEGA